MGPYAGYIVQTLVTLLAVCAIAFAVLYGARRMGVGQARGPIELVGLLPLEARRSIYLVKVAGNVIVVGASEAGFTKLGEIPAIDVPPETKLASAGFSDILGRVLRRGAPVGGDLVGRSPGENDVSRAADQNGSGDR